MDKKNKQALLKRIKDLKAKGSNGTNPTEPTVAPKKPKQSNPDAEKKSMGDKNCLEGVNIGKQVAFGNTTAKDSAQRSREMLEWIIHPTKIDTFYSEYFEKKPLFIRRQSPEYYASWWTRETLDQTVKDNELTYGQDVNLVNYKDGKRHDMRVGEKVVAETMWQAVDDEKCSVRVLRPQEYNQDLSLMLSILDEFFHCNSGVNSYYTPPGAQGFAPHWDDVDTFIMQTEGSKRWRVYRTPTTDTLPRYSSGDFAQEEIGKPYLEETIRAGDLLYMPRGWIHQGYTSK
jgi:lysine-specific demethylase/histidyl-hydroxylase NO66